MRALAVVIALAFLAPVVPAAAPGDASVAWLANRLQVSVGDLPATMPVQQWTLHGGQVAVRDAALPTPQLAAAMRDAELRVVPTPAVPTFAGAGVRGVSGSGVSWTGFAVGTLAMPCIAVTSLADTPANVPPLVNPGGPLSVALSASLPDANYVNRGATATMDAQLVPAGLHTAVPSVAAQSALFDGVVTSLCYQSFSLRVSYASYVGDGTIAGR